ncbi:hypothetical protein Naga_100187g2 [Nannochloropsis gaditana]|uniref:Uncharacterized protein n=1 Tax=Nannochloropsis gaditana TaxID=72520 RepID=W7U4U5_9STRA|nr:hypothetical protein Naga_100187g2 [Nannochloropsis gaditana]
MSSSLSFSNDALRPSLPPTSQGPRQQPEQQIPKPKVILLLHSDKQNHGLLQKLKRHADLVKFTNLETSDAVVSCRNRTLSLLLLTLNEMNNPSLFAKTVIRLSNFQAKSSQHPIARPRRCLPRSL